MKRNVLALVFGAATFASGGAFAQNYCRTITTVARADF